jgi:hypothetical protein
LSFHQIRKFVNAKSGKQKLQCLLLNVIKLFDGIIQLIGSTFLEALNAILPFYSQTTKDPVWLMQLFG